MQRKQSRTVDLREFTVDEIDALAALGMLYLAASPHAGEVAFNRLHSAACNPGKVVSKVPRASLQAFADAVRPFVPEVAAVRPVLPEAMTKLDARLRAGMGPAPTPDLWEGRARDATRVACELRRTLGYPPTDREIESAMCWKAGDLRKWRNHKPGMFPPAA